MPLGLYCMYVKKATLGKQDSMDKHTMHVDIVSSNYICDLAWENRAYVHIKFESLEVNNFLFKYTIYMQFVPLMQKSIYNLQILSNIFRKKDIH